MANSATLTQVLDSFSRKNDVAAFAQDLTKAITEGDKLSAIKAITDLANIFAGVAEATGISNQELAKLGIDGNSSWVKIGNNYINPVSKFTSISLNLYEIATDLRDDKAIKWGPVLGLVDDGSDAMSALSLRVGYVPLSLGLKTVSVAAGGLSVVVGDVVFYANNPTHIPTVQENLTAGKSPSGGVFGQLTDTGGKYAIFATKNSDGTINELLIPMQGSTITDSRVASGIPTKYTYTSQGVPTQIEYSGSVVALSSTSGEVIGSARTYSDSSYGLLTGILSTTDFLSGSIDDESNVFANSSSKSKYGTIAGIRKAAGTLGAGEKWGGQTFATAASSNLGSYLSNINFVDPSSAYQSAVVNSFNFNTNFGGYVPPSAINVQVIFGWPVVLDLNQNGVELISLDESRALYDMNGTGFRQHTAWVAPSDALLAIDYNNDGVIKERKEINFVDWTNSPNLTDMEALALAFDSNKNNKLDSGDIDFLKFRVWQDKNADGVSDASELQTLAQAGIASIDLTTTKMGWSSGASKINALGTYTKLDGSQGLLTDAAFGHESAGWKSSVVNGIQKVINENGDVYGVANSTGAFVVNLSSEGLTGAIGGVSADNMTTTGTTAVFMQGNAGNDSLAGGDGDDWLEGGVGSDHISGGAGDDTVIVDAEDTLANITGGTGFDIIVFEGGTSFNIQLNLTNSFESAVGGEGNDNISAQTYYTVPVFRTRRATNGTYFIESLKGYTNLPLIQTYIISGGAGNDTIRGGVGNDILEGGAGDDLIYGDWGNDTYLFNKGDGRDTILDTLSKNWNYGPEKMLYSNYAPPAWINGGINMGTDDPYEWLSGGEAQPTLRPHFFNTGQTHVASNNIRNSDTIRFGKGILAAEVVKELTDYINGGINGLYRDLIIGITESKLYTSVTQLNDYIYIDNAYNVWNAIEHIEFFDGTKVLISNWFQGTLGANASDTLTGNASDNLLNGLAGADVMSGGAGNDIYVVDNINDQVLEGVNQGTDTVQTSINLNAGLQANVENLTLIGSGNINGTGNSLANVITGNAGNNTLNGGDGVDTLAGGDGNDTYIVDTLTDTITELENGGIDTVQSSITYTLSGHLNLENITLSGSDEINATGNALDNILQGNSAKNVLNGGAGVDTLMGGSGDDVYIVDSPFDLIQEREDEGVDIVETSVTYTLNEQVENLILTGSGNINATGNYLDNIITGNTGNNILNGVSGNDTLIGGAGNDTYTVAQREFEGEGSYIAVINDTDTAAGNIDTIEVDFENVLSQEAYNGPDGAYTLYLDVKRQLTNDGHDNLQLTARGVYISDSPYTYGEDFGGFLIQDQFKSTSKIEEIKFVTDEVDTLDSYLSRVGYDFYGSDNNDLMKADNAIGARYYYAGEGSDYLLGNSSAQQFYGNQGNDILQGIAGNDYLYGNESNDLLDGGVGADRLSGDIGNDLFIGGEDADTINVGSGYDVILFNKGDGLDIVNASTDTDNTLSLGGNFAYGDLSLTKTSSDLILKMGTSDQITFKSWYSSSANNKSILNLQVILSDTQFSAANNLRNNKVETFNFADMVAAFDAAGSLANWQLTESRLSTHLKSGSDYEAIGGDIAYQYGKSGSLVGMGLLATQGALSNPSFGQTAQAFSTTTIGSAETIKLA